MLSRRKHLHLPVLEAVERLTGDAYAVTIMDEVSKREKREVAYSSIHGALNDLSSQGLLSSEFGAPTQVRGGRRKKLYELTKAGRMALVEARTFYIKRARSLKALVPNIAGGGS